MYSCNLISKLFLIQSFHKLNNRSLISKESNWNVRSASNAKTNFKENLYKTKTNFQSSGKSFQNQFNNNKTQNNNKHFKASFCLLRKTTEKTQTYCRFQNPIKNKMEVTNKTPVKSNSILVKRLFKFYSSKHHPNSSQDTLQR